jgi:hypothetical protein
LIRSGRRTLGALLAASIAFPAVAAAQERCAPIRGLTNADGRHFVDVAVGFARNPLRTSIRVGRTEALPTPEDCTLNADEDDLELSCTWRPGDYAATTAFFDSLFARFQSCLTPRLAPAAGPRVYGGTATALRESLSEFATAGGKTGLELRLIEMPETQIPAYHYVTLSILYEKEEADD